MTSGSGQASGKSWRHAASFRFYAELNDFLPADKRGLSFEHAFAGTPAVKDTIEAIGVPHTEVDLILVDGIPAGFEHQLRGGERVAVYPVFERFDITPENRLRPRPLREPRFVLDVHLGKLARFLRLLGFDAAYDTGAGDAAIAARSVTERRIVLTRDRGLLKRREVTHGYWVRHRAPSEQVCEVVRALDLRSGMRPFTRCMTCNGALETLDERTVLELLPSRVRGRYRTIARCRDCQRLFWPGSHYARLSRIVESLAGGC